MEADMEDSENHGQYKPFNYRSLSEDDKETYQRVITLMLSGGFKGIIISELKKNESERMPYEELKKLAGCYFFFSGQPNFSKPTSEEWILFKDAGLIDVW